MKHKYEKGLSLLEILVSMSIFTILAIIATQSVILTFRGSRKSESITQVRENIDYSMSVIERNLRNAESITECPLPNNQIVNYIDDAGNSASFSCDLAQGYIASNSARLTSKDVNVTSCIFSCELGNAATPDSILIKLTGVKANAEGADETSTVSRSSRIILRSY